MTKGEFRNVCKRGVKKGGCVRDVLVEREIIKLILSYKKPKSYKYYNNKILKYRQDNSRFYNILLYNALDFEVSMRNVTYMLRRRKNYNIFVPKVQNFEINIVKFRLPLSRNNFKIKEPEGYKNHNNIIINVAIIPVLGVCVLRNGLGNKKVCKSLKNAKDSVNLDSNTYYKNVNFIESRLQNLDSKNAKKKDSIESRANKIIESSNLQNFKNLQKPENIESRQIVTFNNINAMKNVTFSNLDSNHYNLHKGMIFKRIGFGKGMYDRFYARCKIKPRTIFVSRKLQAIGENICESHDIESKIYLSVFKASKTT